VNSTLNSQVIRRMIINKLATTPLPPWLMGLVQTGAPIESNSANQRYGDLFSAPVMREWIGPRSAKQLADLAFYIQNKLYEATIDIEVQWMLTEQLGLIMDRIKQLPTRSIQHWSRLVHALVLAGDSAPCYDGQYFFSASHPTGTNSGTVMSNLVPCDISAYPVAVHGSTTNPSVGEAAAALLETATRIRSFTDDEGEPMNEDVENFLVLCPTTLESPFLAAAGGQPLPVTDGAIEALRASNRRFTIRGTPRLNSWTTKFAMFALDAPCAPFILQQVGETNQTSKAEGSDYEHDTKRHQHGVDAARGAGYCGWQSAALATLG